MIDLLPYILSLFLTLIVGVYAFLRRQVAGAKAFLLVILIELIQTVGYIFELVNETLTGKMFWDNFQWFTSLFSAVFLLTFAHAYIDNLGPRVRRWLAGLAGVAILIGVIISVDYFPGWGPLSPRLIPAEPFSIYTYDFGLVLFLASTFLYGLFIRGMAILIKAYFQQEREYRKQTFFIILGFMIPIASGLLVVFGVSLLPNRDTLPFAFAIANLILGFGLFYYRMFDIVPIARSMVMDLGTDPMFILNSQDIVLDANPASEKFLQIKKHKLVNKPIREFIPSLLPFYEVIQTSIFKEEFLISHGDELGYFELNSTLCKDRLGKGTGRLLILHDLTARKMTEDQLQKNNDLLEERVSTRTLELQQVNEILKMEVETRRKAEHEKESYAHEMETLFNIALEISELPEGTDVEEFFANRIKVLNQAFFVLLAIYDPDQKELSPRHIAIDEKPMAEIIRILGGDPRRMKLPVSDAIYERVMNEVVMYRQSLSDSMYGVIEPKIGELIQSTFDLDQFVGVAIQSNGKLAASMVIALKRNTAVPSQKFYESLANLASVVFWKK